MSIISLNNVTKYFGSNLLLDHISFSINKNERVALIGNNGSGKTTIFKLILGEEEISYIPSENSKGEISILKNTSIGYLNQNCISNIENTVHEELLLCFEKEIEEQKLFEEISKKFSQNPNDKKLEDKYNELLSKQENNYNYENKIKEYLSRFNFDETYLDRKISTLSGGERMKIAFVKILLFNYDILLLDEPTNHLDISTIEWLEEYLLNYDGTILFISHDRYFLNKLATKILDLEYKKVTTYTLSYDDYLVQKRINYESLVKKAQREDILIEKYKRFIEFYMPKPRFASRARDRVHKLEKLEKNKTVVLKEDKKKINFKIEGNNLKDKQLLKFINVEIGYDKSLIPSPLNFVLYGKDRLAIIGDNGIGKSTLVKSLINEIPLIKGEIRKLRELNIGYIKQNDYEFNKNETAISYLKERYPNKLESELRNYLGRFLFKGDDIFKSTLEMSNGEKMRLILCAFTISSYDIIVLDEPTNHLDMVTKECLLESLKNYEGSIIFVSHDRYFVNELASRVLYFNKDNLLLLDGNYEDLKIELNKKEIELKSLLELEKNLDKEEITVKKEKLSNNAINKLKEEMEDIELSLKVIEDKFTDPNTKYDEFNDLNEEKSNLETRYYEIIDILENN